MRVTLTPQADHLLAAVEGAFVHEKLSGILQEIFAACSSQGLRKILVDIRGVEGEFSLMARYDFGRLAAGFQREPVCLAVIASPDQIWPDRFAENVANNRGLRAKVFTETTEAFQWLHENTTH